jgi:hypothetical protein
MFEQIVRAQILNVPRRLGRDGRLHICSSTGNGSLYSCGKRELRWTTTLLKEG